MVASALALGLTERYGWGGMPGNRSGGGIGARGVIQSNAVDSLRFPLRAAAPLRGGVERPMTPEVGSFLPLRPSGAPTLRGVGLLAGVVLAIGLVGCGGEALVPGDKEAGGQETPKEKKIKGPQVGEDIPGARPAGRAGEWYAGDPEKLDAQIEGFIQTSGAKVEGKPRAVLTPHGGVKHSGLMAGEVWARVEVPPVVVVLSPNHFPDGARLAIWTEGPWLVPGHALNVDPELTALARKHMPQLVPDRAAFSHHETEMQMPFLQYKRPDVRLVLITLRDSEKSHFQGTTRAEIDTLGAGLAAFLQELEATGVDHMLLLTTDLAHYVPLAQEQAEDGQLMSYITQYDVDGLYNYVTQEKVSICGEFPAAVAMTALKTLGRPPMQWHKWGNNFHTSKKTDRLVGYPGGILWP